MVLDIAQERLQGNVVVKDRQRFSFNLVGGFSEIKLQSLGSDWYSGANGIGRFS